MFNPTLELLINPTFWVCLATFLILLWQFNRFRRQPGGALRARTTIYRFLTGPIPLITLIVAGISRAGFAMYMGYVAPLDIMQDVVSARQILHGESAYPSDMRLKIWDSLERNPPAVSLGRWIPGLRQKEIWETHAFLSVQAHPPFSLITAVPMVALFGPHGTALCVDLLSLAGLCLIIILVSKSDAIQLSSRLAALAFAAMLAWEPTLSLLRQGQSGLLIAPLLVLGWFLLRRGRPVLAGIPLGVATCLKLYPGLLLVYLLFRHRRALASALLTILVLSAAPVPFVGWRIYPEYYSSARIIAKMYGNYPANLSLLGLLTKNGLPVSGAFVGLVGLVVVGAVIWRLQKTTKPQLGNRFDLEFSLFLILMLLLSPISWDHYWVLLILPIVVLGEEVLSKPTWIDLVGFCILILLLSIPLQTWVFPFSTRVSSAGVNVRTASIPTFALIAFAAWIAKIRMKAASSDDLNDCRLKARWVR